jgi:hypothetical protein
VVQIKLLIIIFIFFLSGCGKAEEKCNNSPNADFTFCSYLYDSGASSSALYIVKVKDNTESNRTLKVFEGTRGWPVETGWIDNNNLYIKFCNSNKSPKFYLDKANFGNKTINIRLITQKKIMINFYTVFN